MSSSAPKAPYASHPADTRGRLHPETRLNPSERTVYQRDRDRIVHSIAFRRLRHKTQVFVAPDGDHFRVRLTHSLEVAQIARTIARALALDEDLTEALALAHDLGHPPFGHAGEDALTAAARGHGGFDHNAQTLRILTRLETPYPHWDGLNLSWETLEGLAKHNGPINAPLPWALAEADAAMPLDLARWPSLEAQVAAIADDIAYDNHDIDDGLRAGVLSLDRLLAEPMLEHAWCAVCDRLPGVPHQRRLRELVRDQIGAMVADVIAESRRRIAEAEIATADDVRAAGCALVGFSPAMAEDERTLKRRLYAELYHSPQQIAVATRAGEVVAALYAAYAADPARLPDHWRAALPEDSVAAGRHITDFIAGMTDRYAIRRYEELVGPAELPEGF